MKTRMILLCLLFLIVGCGTKQSESELRSESLSFDAVDDAVPVEKAEAITVKSVSQNAPQQQLPNDLYSNGKTKLIKRLNYRFEVDDVDQTTAALEAAVKKYPAYISDSKMSFEHAQVENEIIIRVQNEFFQDLVKDIDLLAKTVSYRDITTEDVAKEFVDLESRLKTKREVEQRYAEILRKQAGTITELLEAEQKIGELHEEIEATISRINYLKDQVSYSTINLKFYQPVPQQTVIAQGDTLGEDFANASSTGWNGIINFVLMLAYIWPLVLIGIATGTYYWLKRRRVLVQS